MLHEVPPKPSFVLQMSRNLQQSFSSFGSRLQNINQWIANKIGITSRRVFQIELGALSAFGFTMMQIGEWGLAIGCWVLLGIILFSKAFSWGGINGRKGLTILLRLSFATGALVLCVVLIMITDLRKPDTEPWSNLQKLGKKKSVLTVQVPVPISFRLGCEWGHIPIHIPAASTIHVLRINPGTLHGNPNIQDLGVFENVSSSHDAAVDWPSKRDGRWMNKSEVQKVIREAHGIPNPWAFKCTITSYSSPTLDEIVAELLIDTPDKKRHIYPVAFDPLMSGQFFSFYVVSVCSAGVIPELVQWGDFATVRVLGEQKSRRVPLRYEKKNWPSQLIPTFGPSSFLWNGMQDCQWDK